MFGYVRVRRDTMPEGAWYAYEAVYCQLCRTMGLRCGQASRLFLNYDFAFLAMLTAPPEAEPGHLCRRCPAHPFRGRPGCAVGSRTGSWLEEVADKSILLTWWKLMDTAVDGSPFQRVTAGFLRLCLKRAYQRAKTACPGFDETAADTLGELRQMEEAQCASIDRTADCFARLLAAAAPQTANPVLRRTMEHLLYHLGRWIYLIDAVDDLEEDQSKGRYNPVSARFPAWSREDQTYLRRSLDHSLGLAGAAFQLLPENAWTAVMENVIYSGLPSVEELVFSGRWRKYQTMHRREAHERSIPCIGSRTKRQR